MLRPYGGQCYLSNSLSKDALEDINCDVKPRLTNRVSIDLDRNSHRRTYLWRDFSKRDCCHESIFGRKPIINAEIDDRRGAMYKLPKI